LIYLFQNNGRAGVGVINSGTAMIRRFFMTILTLISLAAAAQAAVTDWTVHIKVSVPDSGMPDGTVWNHLIAGVREEATDGFDTAWDTLSMVETDDPVQSMFTHGIEPEDNDNDGMIDKWTCADPEVGYAGYECGLWRDVRAFGGENVWSFPVLSLINGGTVSMQWSFDHKPAGVEIVLVDLSNPSEIIDMKNRTSITYTNNFDKGKKYGIRNFELRMKTKGLVITSNLLTDATVDTPYKSTLSAVGGMAVWSLAAGYLPPGMYLDAFTGEIGGIPDTAGSYNFTVSADDTSTGSYTSKDYSLTINPAPVIDSRVLPGGIAGGDYYGQIGATGGSRPLSWRINGNLPEGLVLDRNNGVISGRLLIPGYYDFTATVKDINGSMDYRGFRIEVTEPDDKHPPEPIKNLRAMYVTSTSVLLSWAAPQDDSMTRTSALYDLRFIKDCASGGLMEEMWDLASEAHGEPRPQAGALQIYTLTGLSPDNAYCIAIKSVDAAGHISATSNVEKVFLTNNGEIPESLRLEITLNLRKGYNLISLPLMPVPNGRDSLFASNTGDPVGLYRWYSAYPGITPPQYYLEETVMPGLGYLLYSPWDNVSFKVEGVKITDSAFPVMLQSGWNMIGTPYDSPVLLSHISVRKMKENYTKEEKNYTDAVKNGWIGNTIYYLNHGNYDFASFNDNPPAVLEPGIGYWIYVGEPGGIEIVFNRS